MTTLALTLTEIAECLARGDDRAAYAAYDRYVREASTLRGSNYRAGLIRRAGYTIRGDRVVRA